MLPDGWEIRRVGRRILSHPILSKSAKLLYTSILLNTNDGRTVRDLEDMRYSLKITKSDFERAKKELIEYGLIKKEKRHWIFYRNPHPRNGKVIRDILDWCMMVPKGEESPCISMN